MGNVSWIQLEKKRRNDQVERIKMIEARDEAEKFGFVRI